MNELWMVRAGRDSVYVDDFLDQELVAIGWDELGPVEEGEAKDQVLERYKAAYPERSVGNAQAGVSQIVRFVNEIRVGDTVVTYDRDRRSYFVGEILSDARWSPDKIPGMPRVRQVDWTHRVTRDRLRADTKNTLGAIQTLFQVNEHATEDILDKMVPMGQPEQEYEHAGDVRPRRTEGEILREQEISVELLERAEEAIEERIVRLDWEGVQELVAGVLRAMGYRATVSPRGADRGVDIFASPDGLGLEDPRIFVEVKHRPSGSVGSPQIRSFLGGRTAGDKCLYVSTGGFTKDARYEADRASVPIQLIGVTGLRRLLVDNYEQLDDKTRSLVPLRRVYVLAD